MKASEMKKITLTTAIFFLLFAGCDIVFAQEKDTLSTTILTDSSKTGVVSLIEGVRGSITGIRFLSAGLLGTEITFQDSWDGINFLDVYKNDGTELKFTVGATRKIVFEPIDLVSFAYYIRIRTGTSAVPVVQTSDQDIMIELIDFF